jgi:diguanylate cyclase (GGDEF)-like protein/PAS domain S-box-containing protein
MAYKNKTKAKEKTKQQLVKKIDSLKKRIKKLGELGLRLKHKDKELKEFDRALEDRVESRTSAERIVHKQLHNEIDQRKQSERAIQDALEYANSIINTVREPLIVLNEDLRVISASRSFYQIFKVKPKETEKQHIFDLGNRQWDIPKLRELLEDILPKATSFDSFEVEHDFPGIGKRIMLLNARKIFRESNHVHLILLAIEDITERKGLEEKLKALASRDELTGCVNFRSIMEFLESEIARSRRYQKKFSVVMTDIDNFKRINDDHGHLAGNDALVAFANVVKNSVRSIDIVGRYGGDEFIIVLPESDSQHALIVLERIRNDFKRTKITSPHVENTEELKFKFSAGIAVFPYNAKDLKELIWVADNALRQAKQEGKDQVVLEKRKLIRLNPISGTRIEIVDSFGKEKVKNLKLGNISKEGMLLLSTQDILEEELLCRIYCPKGGPPFELTCKVKHKGKSESELYRIGVYFPDIPETVKEKLSSCIESPKESG